MLAPLADQPVTDVAAGLARVAGVSEAQDGLGHVGLFAPTTARQLLQGTPVAVACVEVHARVYRRRILPEQFFHPAAAFEEVLPGNAGDDRQIGQRACDALGVLEGKGFAARPGYGKGRRQIRQKMAKRIDQNFHAGETQHGRQRPELGDAQRHAILIDAHELHQGGHRQLQTRRVQIALGDGEDTWQALLTRVAQPR